MTSEFFRGHVEGEEMDPKERLTVIECGIGQGVDFFDLSVGHGKAADGNIGTMNHDEGAGAVVGFVEGIWVANIEGEVEVALRVHLARLDEVKAFGHLPVALMLLWPQSPRCCGNGVGPEESEFLPFPDPEFESLLFLESAKEDGGAPSEVFFLEGLFKRRSHLGFDCGEAFRTAGVVFRGDIEFLGMSGGVDELEAKPSGTECQND